MSYSYEKRMSLRDRADQASQLDESDNRPLQCSHNTHLKNIVEYDDCEFGLLVTDIQHYAYHLIFRKKPYVRDILGLTYKQNTWSLNTMWSDILCLSCSIGWSKEDTLAEVERAKLYWYAMLAIDPIES